MFDDYEDEQRMHDLWHAIRIERPVKYSLFTFGESVMPYYLVLGTEGSKDMVAIRKGDVRVARATIITPDSMRPEFQNFFEDAEHEHMIDFLLSRSAAFSNLKVSNQHGPDQIVSDSVEEAVGKLNRQLDQEEEEHIAILSAPAELAGIAILRYTAERIWQSTPDNVQELRERGFLPKRMGSAISAGSLSPLQKWSAQRTLQKLCCGNLMKDSLRSSLFILTILIFILGMGTLGFLIIEDDHSHWEAFRRTVVTITPMSHSDLHEVSLLGQMFSVILVFCGVGSVLLFATQFARLLVASELQGVGIFTKRQMEKRIKRMRNHYIVCGFDEIGNSICTELDQEDLPFVVITANEEAASLALKQGFAVVKGNPTNDATLKEAGVERAAGVIAALPADADNLFIALSAREMNPRILVISRGEEAGVEHRMLRAGADIVVSPMKLGGQQIARLILQQSGTKPQPLGDHNHEHLASNVLGFSLRLYRLQEGAAQTVKEALDQTGALSAVAIQHPEGITTNPAMDAELVENDVLVMLMKSEAPSEDRVTKEPVVHRILLADDHRALRMLFARKIQSAGHEVLAAGSGEEALQLAMEHRPDLIVLDVMMPGLSGYEVCQSLRESGFEKTPIILYSGEDGEEFPRQGQAAGANRCIRKSSKSSELLNEIQDLLATLS